MRSAVKKWGLEYDRESPHSTAYCTGGSYGAIQICRYSGDVHSKRLVRLLQSAERERQRQPVGYDVPVIFRLRHRESTRKERRKSRAKEAHSKAEFEKLIAELVNARSLNFGVYLGFIFIVWGLLSSKLVKAHHFRNGSVSTFVALRRSSSNVKNRVQIPPLRPLIKSLIYQ